MGDAQIVKYRFPEGHDEQRWLQGIAFCLYEKPSIGRQDLINCERKTFLHVIGIRRAICVLLLHECGPPQ